MQIRVGTENDLWNVSELAGEVFAPYGDYRQVLPDYLLSQNVTTFVCENNGRFAGFIQVALEQGDGRDRPPLWADVVSVAVHPDFQSRGFGTELFRHAFASLDRVRPADQPFEVWLTVAHTNERGIKLFGQLGFQMTGVQAGDYVGGQRALRMCKVLSPIRQKGT